MATTPIANAARVTFKLQKDSDLEQYQFSFGTNKRDSADWAGLLDAAETTWVDNLGGLIARSHLIGVAYSEWGTSGFTGFHQKASIAVSHASSSGNSLPPQCAAVVSLLDTLDTGISLKRRRGRIFHGMLPASSVDSEGRLTGTYQGGLIDAWSAVDADIRAVTFPTGQDDFAGLCSVSEAEGVLVFSDHIGVGLGVDTQRRRRRHVVESIAYVTNPA